jgi:hypothetical protein
VPGFTTQCTSLFCFLMGIWSYKGVRRPHMPVHHGGGAALHRKQFQALTVMCLCPSLPVAVESGKLGDTRGVSLGFCHLSRAKWWSVLPAVIEVIPWCWTKKRPPSTSTPRKSPFHSPLPLHSDCRYPRAHPRNCIVARGRPQHHLHQNRLSRVFITNYGSLHSHIGIVKGLPPLARSQSHREGTNA